MNKKTSNKPNNKPAAPVAKKGKPAANVAGTVAKGITAILEFFKPVGIAADVVAAYAKDGAEKVFSAIGTEFATVKDALTYRGAIAAHLFVAEQKTREVPAKTYNKLLEEYLKDIVGWRMARTMPGLGYLILKHHLTPDEVKGKVAVIVWNESSLKECVTREDFLATVAKLKVAKKEEVATGKVKGADQKMTVPTAANICAVLERFLGAHKEIGVTFAEIAEEIDEDATASPFNFIVGLVLAATGKAERKEAVKAAILAKTRAA